jgi:hypothetical protein
MTFQYHCSEGVHIFFHFPTRQAPFCPLCFRRAWGPPVHPALSATFIPHGLCLHCILFPPLPPPLALYLDAVARHRPPICMLCSITTPTQRCTAVCGTEEPIASPPPIFLSFFTPSPQTHPPPIHFRTEGCVLFARQKSMSVSEKNFFIFLLQGSASRVSVQVKITCLCPSAALLCDVLVSEYQ